MPQLSDAIRYAESADTTEDELRRACEILALPSEGSADELRGRLRQHLATLDSVRPVVCLNPGPISRASARGGPRLRRPLAGEFAPVFTDEIALVPEAPDFAALLERQIDVTRAIAATFGEEHAALRYAPGKWSVRQTLGHLSDCERLLSGRLLRALRRDETLLPGFDQVAFVEAGRFEERRLADVLDELAAVRSATAALVRGAAAEDFEFRLRVGRGTITGVGLAYLIAGHERHHQRLLRTLYLEQLPSAGAPPHR